MQGEHEERVNLSVRDQREEAIPRRGDVTVTMMLTRRLLPRIRDGHICTGIDRAGLAFLVEAQSLARARGPSARPWIAAIGPSHTATEAGIEVDGFASRGTSLL
jgi:hypothetical protein